MILAGTQLTAAQLYEYAGRAGWTGVDRQIIVQIALAESRGWTAAQGDETLAGQRTPDGRHWGRSWGVLQIRSIAEERGTGKDRDETLLTDPLRSFQVALRIYHQSHNTGANGFKPWSTYNNGDYKKFNAVGSRASQTNPNVVTTAGQDTGGLDAPLAVGGIDTTLRTDLETGIANFELDGVTNLRSGVQSARVSLSTSQVSEIGVTIAGIDVLKSVKIGALNARLGQWVFRTAAIEVSSGPGTGRTALTFRSAVAQNLKHPPFVGASDGSSWAKMSPSEVLAKVAKYVVAQPSAQREQLVVNGPDKGPDGADKPDTAQSFWSAAQTWADELGYWLFESTGTIYFGKPSWLAAVLPTLEIAWQGKPADSLLELPTFRITEDDGTTDATVNVTFRLHWRTGVLCRPGMAVRVTGVGPTLSGRYIITNVTGDLATNEPWTIEAVSIIDPTPTPTDAELDAGEANGFADEEVIDPTATPDFDTSSIEFPSSDFGPDATEESSLTGVYGFAGDPNASTPTTSPTKAPSLPTGASGHQFGAPAGQSHITGEKLVYIGYGSHRLTVAAALAWKAASEEVGAPIAITDSYRTHEMQAAAFKAKPGLATKPGKSWHEKGVAIDVTNSSNQRIVQALERAGFKRFSPSKEPWHWSFGGVG